MIAKHLGLMALALLLMGQDTRACDLSKSQDPPWLATHDPVVAKHAKLTASFGPRFHPILNTTQMHSGIDWAAPLGSPVIAAAQGWVVYAGTNGPHGVMVLIAHPKGWQTTYEHLESAAVKVGALVRYRDLIGKVGVTGLSSGPHLHFEILHNGTPVDPLCVPLLATSDGPRL